MTRRSSKRGRVAMAVLVILGLLHPGRWADLWRMTAPTPPTR
jgi:hypothetical protein